MLTNRPVTTILPVTNLDRAKKFYTENLGLQPSEEKPPEDAILVEAGGGARLELLKRDHAARSDYTAVSFEVDDVEREVTDLERRGVRFEDYDLPGLKTERHIATMDGERAAWFKDPDGNILCIHQRIR